MAKAYFLPADDGGKAELLEHFAAKLPKYADLLEIGRAELTASEADAVAFRAALQGQQHAQTHAQQWTAYKNLLRDGGNPEAAPPPPLAPPAPTPAAVAPGVIPRFTALAVRIKNHRNYTPAIGEDLGIVGPEQVTDSSGWKPVLSIQIQAGRPLVKWTKGGADALELWVDRGQGFAFLAVDLQPDFPDPAPLPAPGTGAVWKYKAIYRLHDEQVGQWSDVISVTVGG